MTEFKVLIVDDSPFMRKVFSDVIDADAAFKVLATASNGYEAVDLALKLKPDIITMDLEMPEMNGIEALQKIMSIQPTPVIMLSAVTDNGTRDTIKALQYGAIDFIRKPDGAVNLDIRQVGEHLLEKLRVASETMSSGAALRMLPAVEEKVVVIEQPPPMLDSTTSKVIELPKKSDVSAHASLNKEIIDSVKPVAEKVIMKHKDLPRKLDGLAEKQYPIPPSSIPSNSSTGVIKSKRSELQSEVKDIVRRQVNKATSVLGESKVKATHNPRVPAAVNKDKLAQADPINKQVANGNHSTTFTHLVAIGTSTGGPRALHEVLTGIPADFPAPILVVQHMPPKFTHSLAQRLDNFCSIHVREAVDGEIVETATAYIAPGGRHMSLGKELSGKYRIKLSDEGPRSGHMPSVDVLFESLLGHQQLKRHVVLMTGMGSDGAKGMKALQIDGVQTTIAEAEQTCVVYGMPRSAVELGAVSHLLPLQGIAPVLVQEVQTRKP
ncbi:chemotaxis response regulator protein-glutamate methylesterase [Cohnella sp. WQ 127256]|uniref:protein-glutamate methylesterase/protein-glutamine glutaminase n=1 Tax=Cohnella sp. WQ 127256 TaxID=2938790 RepID=UPI0021198D55|nr:chemotaxis response regulator protein-glutamate methylesterase [Cohnella sp. WQ 127256]